MSDASEFRHLVRMSGRDLDGSKKLVVAVSDLRGVGYNFANVVTMRLGIDPKVRLGTLTDEQVKEVEKAARRLVKQRFLLEEDAQRFIQAAEARPVPLAAQRARKRPFTKARSIIRKEWTD